LGVASFDSGHEFHPRAAQRAEIMAMETDTDAPASPTSRPTSASPSGTKGQPGWIVTELSGVGWVVKELPTEDTGGIIDDGDGDEDDELPDLPATQNLARPPVETEAPPVVYQPEPPNLPPPGSPQAGVPMSPSYAPMLLPGAAGQLSPSRPQSASSAMPMSTRTASRPQSAKARPKMEAAFESHAATETPQSLLASLGGTSATTAVPRMGGNGKPAGFDAFVVFELDADRSGRDNKARAAAVTRGLEARGLAVCQQSFLARDVQRHHSSSDEAHFMAQAAQTSACAIILLTRGFIEKVEGGTFGDSCVAAFTLAKRLPNAIIAAMEPDIIDPICWGWNQIFARFSGRAVVDLSMEAEGAQWEKSVDKLAWLLNPRAADTRTVFENGDASLKWPTSPSVFHNHLQTTGPLDVEADKGYHVFISHNWGEDSSGRDNHQRVLKIAQFLQYHGLKVFLDDWEAHRYSSKDEAMIDGMRRSGVVLMFLTQKYIERIEDGKLDDDCVAEFNLAKRAPTIIPVILEKELLTTTKWGWNRVFAHLSGKNVVDLADGDVTPPPALLWTAEAQKLHAALDNLQIRIRSESSRLPPKKVQQKPPPTIPQLHVIQLAVNLIAWAAFLQLLAGLLEISGVTDSFWTFCWSGFTLISLICWDLAFATWALWSWVKARTPPSFEVDTGMVGWISLIGNGIRGAAVFLLLAHQLAGLLDIQEPADILHLIQIAGSVFLALGSFVVFIDAIAASQNVTGNFFQDKLVTPVSFGGWGTVFLFAAGLLQCMATLSEDSAATYRFIAVWAAIVAAIFLWCWTAKSHREVEQYFKAPVAPISPDPLAESPDASFVAIPVDLREAGEGAIAHDVDLTLDVEFPKVDEQRADVALAAKEDAHKRAAGKDADRGLPVKGTDTAAAKEDEGMGASAKEDADKGAPAKEDADTGAPAKEDADKGASAKENAD